MIALIAIMFYTTTNSYDTELEFSDDWKTIKELKENIDYLDKANSELDEEFKNINVDYELKSYFINDLNYTEFHNLKSLVSNFNIKKISLEKQISDKVKKNSSTIDEKKALVEEKRWFFNSLIPYIDSKYNDKYLEYIKSDVQNFEEQKDADADIIIKKEILNNKVVKIETKIQEHKDYINKNIQAIIEKKLDEKIINLKNNESFKTLSWDSKRKILGKTIVKIKDKLSNIKKSIISITNTWSTTKKDDNLIDKKIHTYQVAVEKLENFRDLIK